MTARSVYRAVRRLVGLGIAIAALSGLVWLALDDGVDGARASYPQTVAIVALIAVAAWALLAARSQIRRQEPAEIELLPPQPGDSERTRRSDPRPPAARASAELLAYAPGELDSLRKRVASGVSSRAAYDERLAPVLRELAEARAAHAGRRADVDALVDIGPYLPAEDGVSRLAMRLRSYRTKALTRAVDAVITAIEEID